jgi:hypothetical protein
MTYLTAPTAAGGRGVAHSPEIGAILVRLFYDNIMITLENRLHFLPRSAFKGCLI